MISVLFVDDEPNLTAALKRTFQNRQTRWSMRFANSGAEALAMLRAAPADVVVSDMAMPEMDGASLLTKVKEQFPETILIILSGQCDRGTALKTVDPSHLHLTKPCDTVELTAAIDRACRLRRLLTRVSARPAGRAVSSTAPSPGYQELARMLRDPDVEIEVVAAEIARDQTLTRKLMTLINAAFDDSSWCAKDPLQTINLLGLDLVRSLVLDITQYAHAPAAAR